MRAGQYGENTYTGQLDVVQDLLHPGANSLSRIAPAGMI
jgi:hypothetical protein